MRALFALGTGVMLGTIAALWLAARGDAHRAGQDQRPPLPEIDDAPAEPPALPPATAEPEEASA